MANETIETKVEIVPVADMGIVLMPVMNIQMARKRLAEFQEFVKEYLVADEDYGTIPGTPKPTLLKSGADKLCELYGLSDDYIIEQTVEKWEMNPPLFDYTVRCVLKTRRDERFVGSGLGSCNSWEGKYRYRDTKLKCPLCNQETVIKGKEEYGGGWLCWGKKGGCGAKFLEDDKAIVEQPRGKVENDDVPTLKNTILKMAKKRAKIDAVIAATRSSGIFTQDMEDIEGVQGQETAQGTRKAAERVKDEKLAEYKKKAPEKAAKPPANGTTGSVPSLFYALQPSGKYSVQGDTELMKKIWPQFKSTFHEDKEGKFYMLSEVQLEALKWQCEEGKVPLHVLKGPSE